MIIDFSNIDRLAKELDVKVLKTELISSNIANIDTPGYKAKDLKFDHYLEESMNDLSLKTTNPKHIKDSESAVEGNQIVENKEPGRADGNNVNVEDEMLKLIKNNIDYNITVQLLSKSLARIKTAIEDARR